MKAKNFPLRTVFKNILVGHGEARAALYRINTVSFPWLSVADKRSWLARLGRFAFAAEADFSLWRVHRAYEAEEYVAQAEHMHDERIAEPGGWERYLATHREHLEQHPAFLPEVYIAVSLRPERKPNLKGGFLQGDDRTLSYIGKLFGKITPISKAEIERLETAQERAHRRVSSYLPCRPATTLETQWLLRRAACRGIGEPTIDRYWEPSALSIETTDDRVAYEPREYELIRHMNAPIFEEERTLVVDSERGRSYQAMLALGSLPDAANFPGGAELLFTPLEALGFPVDAVLHARRISNREALKKVQRRVVDADVAYLEQATSAHGPLSFMADEMRVLARDLRATLESHERPPLLDCSISVAVGAASREDLERHVELLGHHYGSVALHRPLGLQPALFLDHLPRADCGTVEDYRDVLTIEQFGALMPIGTHQAGSKRGPYIGSTVTGGQRPIKLDITEASRTGRPPSILLAGTLGSGKTIAAQLFALQAERRGSLIVDVDVKPDHNLEGLPELQDRVHIIELSGDERYRGLLDPLVVAPEILKEDLAATYLTELIPSAPPPWQTQIRKAVRFVLERSQNPCCMDVVAALLASDIEESKAAGDALTVWADSGIARLGFSAGVTNGHMSVRRPVTSIKASALTLPGAGVSRADYDSAERLGAATLKLIAAYAMQLVSGDRSIHKVIFFDEAWALLGTADGRRLVDRLNRMGRGLNVTLILATQQLADAGEIENLIGTRIMFGQETTKEARTALELLGLDPDDKALVERVRGYRRGRCLLRDIDDQVCEMQIDVVAPHILELLDTSPKRQQAMV